jgi:hypothetical protein
LVSGGFSTAELLISTSPDARYRLVVSTRLTFPANDILDPEAFVDIDLFDVHAGKSVDGLQLTIMERSDVGDPAPNGEDAKYASGASNSGTT